ncbi:MAG: tetraacyldisaccharide 4'-kinase [Rhodospirillaceae bacterium]
MKAPAFWYRSPGLRAGLLTPLGLAFSSGGILRRHLTRPFDPGIPVICIGNLVAGGAGKTPVTLAVVALLQAHGIAAHVLTRGYGGSLPGPVQVAPSLHDSAAVGDEALLLAEAAPTLVARDRAAGARAALAAGAEALVLDDGFQNPALVYRFSVLVVDGTVGFGNGCLIPAGPLRETAQRGLARASAVVMMGEDRTGVTDLATQFGLPVFHARLTPDPAAAKALRGRRVLAFCGIGRPAKFFETLREVGAIPVETRAFADHHRFRPAEIDAMLLRARELDAMPLTTAKDFMRLSESTRAQVQVLPVKVTWSRDDGEAFAARLKKTVTGHV